MAGSSLEINQGSVPGDSHVSYDGYHIYSVIPSSPHDARDLTRRFSRYYAHSIRDTLTVAVPPGEIAAFEHLKLNTRLVNSDLGASIRSMDGKPASYIRALHKRGELPHLSWYGSYHLYADRLNYWEDLVHAFPKKLEEVLARKELRG